MEGASQNEGANVYQYYDNDTSAKMWRLEHTGDGYYKLTALCSEKVLMVDILSMTAGSNVVQGTDNGPIISDGLLKPWEMVIISFTQKELHYAWMYIITQALLERMLKSGL